jgi:hypothetical protein
MSMKDAIFYYDQFKKLFKYLLLLNILSKIIAIIHLSSFVGWLDLHSFEYLIIESFKILFVILHHFLLSITNL